MGIGIRILVLLVVSAALAAARAHACQCWPCDSQAGGVSLAQNPDVALIVLGKVVVARWDDSVEGGEIILEIEASDTVKGLKATHYSIRSANGPAGCGVPFGFGFELPFAATKRDDGEYETSECFALCWQHPQNQALFPDHDWSWVQYD